MKSSSITKKIIHFSTKIFSNSGGVLVTLGEGGYLGGTQTINQIVHVLCAGAVVDLFVALVDISDKEGKSPNVILWNLGWSEQELFDLVHWAGHGVQLGF